MSFFFFFQAEDGIRDKLVTGVQTCALPISSRRASRRRPPACSGGTMRSFGKRTATSVRRTSSSPHRPCSSARGSRKRRGIRRPPWRTIASFSSVTTCPVASGWRGWRKLGVGCSGCPATSRMRMLTRDGWLLFLTRCTRLFAYGALSVVLVFYLTSLGLTASQTGILLTLTLVGDTVVSFYLTTRADRIGRRRMLIVGALLMAAAGLAFAYTRNFVFLVVAGTIGVISPSGNEVGPFLP